MQKFKIVVAYDGTDFRGWQSQPHNKTVSDCLNETYQRVFSEQISVVGASRTDAGVHALGQVAMYYSKLDTSCTKIQKAWNDALPESIYIRSLEIAKENFHPLRNVVQKTYYYNLFLKKPLPHVARYGWYYKMVSAVDWAKFEQALKLYEGEHDFRSFCKLDEDKHTVRIVDSIYTKRVSRLNILQIVIKGKSFLHFQIRRMIGYALDVARRKELSVDYIQMLLDNPKPKQTLLRAYGKGLFLKKIIYKE